jgi:ketosteroid isomerase-like protein
VRLWHDRQYDDYEFGLGAADRGYEELWREWKSGGDIVTIEIREKRWLKSAPDDVIDQRTCVVIQFRDGKICDMRDYTDSNIYVEFLKRHPELPKFARQS